MGDGEKKFDIAKATPKEIASYVSKQAAMFEELNKKCIAAGRKPQFANTELAARKYELVPMADGRVMLKKRSCPICCMDDDISFVTGSRKLTSGQVDALNKSINRGKYNDSMRLIGEDTASIEVGELQGCGSNNFSL